LGTGPVNKYREASVIGANCHGAYMSRVDLSYCNLSGANLTGAILSYARLIRTNLKGATLRGCQAYGISAWGVQLEGAIQEDIDITPFEEILAGKRTWQMSTTELDQLIKRRRITVDNLEIAQFIYLLLDNKKIRDIIDSMTSRVVLVLGRFTRERKAVLDAIKRKLRAGNYVPILFDFEKPTSRDLTETMSALAHIARFVIADITDAKSIPQEVMRIIPSLPSVPIQPLLLASESEYAMFEHFRRFPWVLEPFRYRNKKMLLASFEEKILGPLEARIKEAIRK
jgi:uncharacterized protein YjbI with pentapeptide repeats